MIYVNSIFDSSTLSVSQKNRLNCESMAKILSKNKINTFSYSIEKNFSEQYSILHFKKFECITNIYITKVNCFSPLGCPLSRRGMFPMLIFQPFSSARRVPFLFHSFLTFPFLSSAPFLY